MGKRVAKNSKTIEKEERIQEEMDEAFDQAWEKPKTSATLLEAAHEVEKNLRGEMLSTVKRHVIDFVRMRDLNRGRSLHYALDYFYSPTSLIDEAVAELIKEGIVEIEDEKGLQEGSIADGVFVPTYRLTEEGMKKYDRPILSPKDIFADDPKGKHVHRMSYNDYFEDVDLDYLDNGQVFPVEKPKRREEPELNIVFDVKVGKDGRVTIPEATREKNELNEGDILTVKVLSKMRKKGTTETDIGALEDSIEEYMIERGAELKEYVILEHFHGCIGPNKRTEERNLIVTALKNLVNKDRLRMRDLGDQVLYWPK